MKEIKDYTAVVDGTLSVEKVIDLPIGTKIRVSGVILKVVKDTVNACFDCYFKTPCVCNNFACTNIVRRGKTNIIFKKINVREKIKDYSDAVIEEKETKERLDLPINTKMKVNGKILQVLEVTSMFKCDNCHFSNNKNPGNSTVKHHCRSICCDPYERKDEKDVIFKKIDKHERD